MHSFLSVYLFRSGCCLFMQPTVWQLTSLWNRALIALKSLNLSSFFGKCLIQRLTIYITANFPGINSICWQVNQFMETFILVIYSNFIVRGLFKSKLKWKWFLIALRNIYNLSFCSTADNKFINMDSSTFLIKKAECICLKAFQNRIHLG